MDPRSASRDDGSDGLLDGFQADASGNIPPRQQFKLADIEAGLGWTKDGRLLARGFHDGGRGSDVYVLQFQRESVHVEPVLRGDWNEHMARLSPDGKWLLYVSDETGVDEVYVRPFPNVADGRTKISERGGQEPSWARDGRAVYYWEGSSLRRATVSPGAVLSVLNRVTVLTAVDYMPASCCVANYDILPDDGGFVITTRPAGSSTRSELILVENVFLELRARVPRR